MHISIYLRSTECPSMTCATQIISVSLTTCAGTGCLTAASKRSGRLYLYCSNMQTKSSCQQQTTRRCSLSAEIVRSGRTTLSADRKSTDCGRPWTVPVSIRSLSYSIPGCAVARCYSYKKRTSISVNAISASPEARPPPASVSYRYITASHCSSSPE